MGVIETDDTIQDAIFKMGDGNPGAATALLKMKNELGAEKGLWLLLNLDEIGCIGATLYSLYADVCEKDSKKVLTLMEAVWDKEITKEALLEAADSPCCTKYEDLMKGTGDAEEEIQPGAPHPEVEGDREGEGKVLEGS